MTISRKLFQIATIGLSLGTFNASAYDVVGLKDEVQLISAFANECDTAIEYNDQTIYLGYWLKNKINDTWMTSNYDIIQITNIIKQNNVEKLLIRIDFEKRINKTITALMVSALATAGFLMTLEMVSKMVNMHIDGRIFHKTFSSQIETLVTLDKMQQQIDELTQQVNKTWFQKLFAKA